MTKSTRFSSLIALFASFWAGSNVFASPITYTTSFVQNEFSQSSDPLGLAGASITILETWNADVLTPTFDGPAFGGRVTDWPNTNTSINFSIVGSTGGADGTHIGFITGGSLWQLEDNRTTPQAGDNVQFPNVAFTVLGETVEYAGMRVSFLPGFNTPPPPGTVLPYEYGNSDIAQAQLPSALYQSDQFDLASVTAFTSQAQFVPEPSTLVLGTLGLIGLVARLRRGRRADGRHTVDG